MEVTLEEHSKNGLPFEEVLVKLKQGAVIWRESDKSIKWYLDKGIGDQDYVFCNNAFVYICPDLLATDWNYEFVEDDRKDNKDGSYTN